MRFRHFPVALASLAALTLPACGNETEAPPPHHPELTGYVNAMIWNPAAYGGDHTLDREAFVKGTIHVRGGVIVDPGEATPGTLVDLEGAYVIPPLGEAHNHNLDAPAGVKAVSSLYIRDGIFYVKNPNSVPMYSTQARDLLSGPETVDAVFSMGGITVTGGHPETLYVNMLSNFPAYSGWTREDFDGEAFHTADQADQIDAAIERLMGQEPDFVKTYLLFSDQQDDPPRLNEMMELKGLDPEVYDEVVAAVQARGLRVSTHVETAFDFATAVSAGADEINHLPGYFWAEGKGEETYLIPEDVVREAADKGITVVTTTGISKDFYRGRADELAALQATQARNLTNLLEAGVPVVVGSDNYMTTSRFEADNLVALGLSPSTALKLWIDTPKLSIFPERNISCLDPGCEASFIAMTADPSESLDALDTITTRVKAGVAIN